MGTFCYTLNLMYVYACKQTNASHCENKYSSTSVSGSSQPSYRGHRITYRHSVSQRKYKTASWSNVSACVAKVVGISLWYEENNMILLLCLCTTTLFLKCLCTTVGVCVCVYGCAWVHCQDRLCFMLSVYSWIHIVAWADQWH